MFSSVTSRVAPLEQRRQRGLDALDRPGDRDDVVADAERPRARLGVAQRFRRGEAIGQHHGVDASGAQRVDGHGGAERRIDAAGEAEHDAGKPVVLDVIAQAHHAGGVIALVALLYRRALTLGAAPALLAAFPDGARHTRAERGQLDGERAVRVQGERAALEHEFVLAADLVEIDHRQPALDHARNRDALADRELVALVRRGVGNQEDFAAGLGDAFDGLRPPDVLADRHADPDAAKRQRPGRRAGAEHPLLVEHAVIRQIDLEAHRLDAPARQQGDGVVERALLDPGQADQHGGAAVGGLARERLASRAARLLERGLQHQVLGRITRKIQFGREHEVGAERGGLRARCSQAAEIALDVADDGGDLRERDDEPVGGCGHGESLARRRGGGQMGRPFSALAGEGPGGRYPTFSRKGEGETFRIARRGLNHA